MLAGPWSPIRRLDNMLPKTFVGGSSKFSQIIGALLSSESCTALMTWWYHRNQIQKADLGSRRWGSNASRVSTKTKPITEKTTDIGDDATSIADFFILTIFRLVNNGFIHVTFSPWRWFGFSDSTLEFANWKHKSALNRACWFTLNEDMNVRNRSLNAAK